MHRSPPGPVAADRRPKPAVQHLYPDLQSAPGTLITTEGTA